jgi:hypothetical protein
MLKVLDHSRLTQDPRLADSMLRDRAAQFVERHGWNLSLGPDGHEVDEFDAPGTIYCILEEDRRHLASVRLRPARDGSMVERHFRPLWDAFGLGAAPQLGGDATSSRAGTCRAERPRGAADRAVRPMPSAGDSVVLRRCVPVRRPGPLASRLGAAGPRAAGAGRRDAAARQLAGDASRALDAPGPAGQPSSGGRCPRPGSGSLMREHAAACDFRERARLYELPVPARR